MWYRSRSSNTTNVGNGLEFVTPLTRRKRKKSIPVLCYLFVFGVLTLMGSRTIVSNLSNNDISIGYAISVTGCPEDNKKSVSLYDAAAVLSQSIKRASSVGRYKHYTMHALVHKDAVKCTMPFFEEELNYKVHIVDTPVSIDEIETAYLRERISNGGCCGEKELIKLHAYGLTQHPIVVHLDLDTIILKPLDDLFDTMLVNTLTKDTMPSLHIMPSSLSKAKTVDFMFTRDYNMATMHMIKKKHVGVQGGFFVLKPSQQTLKEMKDLLRKGHYTGGNGWGDKGFGPFYGSQTIQGFLPYFYDYIKKGQTSVELNRCYYNNMVENPRDKRTINNVVSGNCKDGREDCPDCRELPVDEVYSAHFTLCQKPWECFPHSQKMLQHELCRSFFSKWYEMRHQYQQEHHGEASQPDKKPKSFHSDIFLGYCKTFGPSGYVPLPRAN